jgi:hypothetical protein
LLLYQGTTFSRAAKPQRSVGLQPLRASARLAQAGTEDTAASTLHLDTFATHAYDLQDQIPMNFHEEYARLRDEELLQIASDRHHLLAEAAMAMDSELARRGLTYETARAQKRQVARREYREFQRHRPSPKVTKYLIPRAKGWTLLLLALGTPALVFSLAALHMIPEPWVFPVLTASMGLVIGISIVQAWLRRTVAFWISLIVACAAQLFVGYWIGARTSLQAGNNAKGAGLLSLFVGYAVGVPLFFLLQKLKPSKEAQDRSPAAPFD